MIFNYDVSGLKSLLDTINFADATSIATASTNLDDYTDGGIWFFGSSYTPTNKPADAGQYGFLVVLKGSSVQRLTQYWIDSATSANSMWMRTNSTSPVSWSSWKRLATDDDISQVQAMFVPTSITTTLENPLPSGVTTASISVVQTGSIVQVMFGITRDSAAIASYTVLATGLPKAKIAPIFNGASIPEAQVRAYVADHTGRFLNCQVNSSGEFRINRGETAGDYIGSFTYITDDYSNLTGV